MGTRRKQSVGRRTFVQTGLGAGAALAVHQQTVRAENELPSNRIRVAVMGVNGRGTALASGFAGQANCEVSHVCDVDERAIGKAKAAVAKKQQSQVEGLEDFRRALEDKSVDALAIAAPNHWHAPAAILACQHNKHAYVEKPCSHTAEEGELAVAAARKHDRVVTMGTQRRSWPAIREAMDKLHAGALGKLHYARTWYNNRRGSIGVGKQTAVPSWLNYDLWQGPAPDRPFKDNLVHYNWHWHWHWGNGELGNNGIHALDLARWGMQVDYPSRVVSSGARHRYSDDQETPDTHLVAFEFAESTISWEGLSWSPLGFNNSMFGVSFHGENGSLVIDGNGYQILDKHNKEVSKQTGEGGDAVHLADFLDSIRNNRRAQADIAEAHKSTLMCHLGNISHRVQRALETDPSNGHILKDEDAQQLWGREYRAGFRPSV